MKNDKLSIQKIFDSGNYALIRKLVNRDHSKKAIRLIKKIEIDRYAVIAGIVPLIFVCLAAVLFLFQFKIS